MRFQNLWAVRQLLLVLSEELRTVRIEPAGAEGEGVDVIVTLPDGRSEYQQCKRSYRQVGKWTLSVLNAEGVLAAIGKQLRTDSEGNFRFVSIDSAPDLRELAESARASLGSTSFYRDQIEVSSARGEAFRVFCGSLQLDPRSEAGLAEAHDLLRRTFTSLMGDDEGELRDLQSMSRYWVDGNPTVVIPALESFAQATLRRAITADDVEAFLGSRGFHLRSLARDQRILPAIRHLQESFKGSLAPQLVGGQLLPRDEAGQIADLLQDPSGPRFIVVHGPAGVGKSGVLLDLADRLENGGVAFLPLRLDRQRPTGTVRQFGESLGLPESPAFCLGALAGDHGAVLLLDQLDALRWTGAYAARALDTCQQLVKEALCFSNLRGVACCRTSDLENDPQIRGWIEHDKARKLPIERLSGKVVKRVVSALGVDPRSLTERQVDLLRTIQHLRAWEETVKITGGTVEFGSERDLLNAFWRSRLLEADRVGIDSGAMQKVVDEIVEYMDRNSSLVAPCWLLRGSPPIEEALLSLNVLTRAKEEISFCHQTYLDHQLAYLLRRRIDEGKATVEGWLTATHQGLFRREQLRLVLGILREDRFNLHLATVRGLIGSTSLRFHLKQLVLQFLGQVEDPKAGEIDLILSLLDEERWREHVIADVLYGHAPWFDAVDATGVVARWLDGGDGERDHAFRLIHSVIKERGEQCYRLLSALVARGEEWNRQVAAALPMAPANDSPSLFELRARLAEAGTDRHYIDWERLGGPHLPRLARMLLAFLSHMSGRESKLSSQSGSLHSLGKVELKENSVGELLAAWKDLVPPTSKAFDPEVEEREFLSFGKVRDWRMYLQGLLRQLAAEMVSRDPQAIMDLLDQHPNQLGELLVIEALPRVTEVNVAERALEWLMSRPDRLRLRWTASDLPWEVSRQAVAQLTQCCSPLACSSFEHFLLEFREPQLRWTMEWRHEALLSPPERQLWFAAWYLARPSVAGQTAYHLLPCLPDDRISIVGQRRLMELKRKFSHVDELFFTGLGKGRGGHVGSPLPSGRLNSFSDRTWLEIIRRNAAAHPEKRWSRYRNGRYEESTPEAFSMDLQSATAREPRRFARLALGFPAETNPVYFGAVIHGLRAQAENRQSVEDATLNELESLIALPQVKSDPSLARDVVWLLESRADLDWSLPVLDLLASIATRHPDPAEGELNVHGDREEWGPSNLMNNALNCTRGAATIAIAKLLFTDPLRIPVFADTIDRIVADPHPAVRAAVFECCLATLDLDPQRAIAWALKSAEGNEALLACSSFDRFLLYASRRHPAEIEPTLRQMLGATREDVRAAGASHAVALYLLTGRLEAEALECAHGTAKLRAAVAQVAAAFAESPEYHEKARAMLLELINDDAEEVLEQCSSAFHDTTLERFAEAPDFLDTYASSRAFKRYPTTLLYRLRDHDGSLVPFARCVLTACRSLAESQINGTDQQQRGFWEADYYLPPVLLRLYEQAPNGSEVREYCLDAWDLLLEARVVSAISLTKKLESE
jgi:hypothetical protein